MNIGEVSKVLEVLAKMIRYYEQIGLILPAALHSSGLRSWVIGGQDQRPPSDTYRTVHFLIP